MNTGYQFEMDSSLCGNDVFLIVFFNIASFAPLRWIICLCRELFCFFTLRPLRLCGETRD
jgi:hypothetical protein